ncbi:BSD domain-containing protein [Pochonia chlamydosporia 170]|uniref:BSD domain-containing protein n=1 Tax=Pochonia chlamydosporia 170 TaxID=1380566 RepID=A0A179G9R0_METCM|nr:BSD domain-containing protein [Pochonia chlamydosporia 170]OAQ73889.1 BSD domain-containing protein [Pochonia chlamydosporia 170]
MDLAYDHIQENAYPQDREESNETPTPEHQEASLNNDLQDAYKAISSSAWGMKIGGFLGTVMKQGESVYAQAQKELAEVGEDASKGFTDLRESILNRTRSLSVNTATPADGTKEADDAQSTPTKAKAGPSDDAAEQSETVLSRLRTEATKRLKDLQKAEDAADEALLRFGSNVRDFLRDAISVAPPDESSQDSTVLFESKDAQGKRVIHTSRFDAQMHVIHTSVEGFAKDPTGDEYEKWTKDFDVEKKTDDISGDLAKYPELRATMEKLVPDQVTYADFWKRYYFLRHGIETAESRRRDLLKAASADDEVGWDDDSDDDEEAEKKTPGQKASSGASSTTIQRPDGLLKPNESRKSNDEKSQADSEASYDVVGATSGKTSQAPNSPKDSKQGDDSDDDWE